MTAVGNASNGDKSTAKQAVQPKHGLSVLREKEAKALIGLASDALSEAHNVAHQMFGVIYRAKEATASYEDLLGLRDDVLGCLSTSEHYLLMLGSVLEDQVVGLSEERAPYPVYMMSPEVTDG